MPRLLAFLEPDNAQATQTSAGDFIKAIVTISANASQNEQSCIGPNNLTRQLVSEPCIENLLSNMLRGGNPLTVGVGMIIEVIRKNNSDYDPDVGAGPDSVPTSNDPIYLGTLLRCFAKRVPDFMNLLLSPTHAVSDGDSQITIKRKELGVAFGNKIEPLGFDRFKTCELMAELLHCSNMGLLNERGSEAFVKERDAERDRLKAEGALTSRMPQSAVTEFSEDSNHFANGVSPLGLSTGPEETRKLEVQNNAEDDGFEDVGSSADLADEIKDDFDEKDDEKEEKSFLESSPPTACLPGLTPKQVKPRLDLDEDFVDEPLTSPKLEAMEEKDADMPDAEIPEPLAISQVDSEHQPETPTAGLASDVKGLTVDQGSLQPNHVSTEPAICASPEPTATSTDHLPSVQNINTDAPPLASNDRPLDPISPDSPQVDNSRGLFPHPDDKPAPLFAKPPTSAPEPDESPMPGEDEPRGGLDQGSINSTQAEEGDTSRSLVMTHMTHTDQDDASNFEVDIDGQPMVGDFLKIMFVEHHVVPTILVCHLFSFRIIY